MSLQLLQPRLLRKAAIRGSQASYWYLQGVVRAKPSCSQEQSAVTVHSQECLPGFLVLKQVQELVYYLPPVVRSQPHHQYPPVYLGCRLYCRFRRPLR